MAALTATLRNIFEGVGEALVTSAVDLTAFLALAADGLAACLVFAAVDLVACLVFGVARPAPGERRLLAERSAGSCDRRLELVVATGFS